MRAKWLMGALIGAALAIPQTAEAFCGFYVSGAGAKMFNNATMVVMMRDGTRTVLSMQNNYQGPPKNFAMVVPVPVVLQKENVKTLPMGVFKRIDALAAPRLVEYWEQDPCMKFYPRKVAFSSRRLRKKPKSMRKKSDKDLGVTVEAKFAVGEYQVVILSATQATGLDTWLRQEKYKIPKGAAKYLRPYVQGGMKFFVAKVDTKKVTFKGNQAMLSPLRFYYDSAEFKLPVRLGLMNSKGTQDLIVHILAKGKRYEVANYKNVAIPTNLDVNNRVRKNFGEFYAALFDATVKRNRGAVVTEYSWDASTCDPCPVPALRYSELMTFGLDVIGRPAHKRAKPGVPGIRRRPRRRWRRRRFGGWVLTRLHARYTARQLKNDLIFREAPPIVGGREMRNAKGKLEKGYAKGRVNNFQGRYAIRHKWKGKVTCKNPVYGRWGGPPGGMHRPTTKPALNLAFAPRRRRSLRRYVRGRLPKMRHRGRHLVKMPKYVAPKPLPPPPPPPPPTPTPAPTPTPPPTATAPVDAGAPAAPPTTPPTPPKTATAPETGDVNTPPPPQPDTPEPVTEPAPTPQPKKSGGCAGCSTTTGGATGGMILILGAALIAIRRKES